MMNIDTDLIWRSCGVQRRNPEGSKEGYLKMVLFELSSEG